jgi:hypothetical protein
MPVGPNQEERTRDDAAVLIALANIECAASPGRSSVFAERAIVEASTARAEHHERRHYERPVNHAFRSEDRLVCTCAAAV